MLHIPISQIIERIHQETGLSIEEVKDQIKAKIAKLEGLVSEEGASYIVASELGVQLFKEADKRGPLKIKDLIAGMRSVEVIGKVTRVMTPKTFLTKDKRQGEVGAVTISDETGTIRLVLWDQKNTLIKEGHLVVDSIVKAKDVQVKQNNLGSKELHASNRSVILIDPKGISVTVATAMSAKKVAIRDIKASESASILATVVQVFPPKFYPVCPKCGKKVTLAPEGAICAEHKTVAPNQSMLINFVLDDCTDTLRAVAFRETAEKLCGLNATEAQEVLTKDGPELLQEKVENFLLGRTIEVEGFVKENINFSRVELTAAKVNFNPDPKSLAINILQGKKHG